MYVSPRSPQMTNHRNLETQEACSFFFSLFCTDCSFPQVVSNLFNRHQQSTKLALLQAVTWPVVRASGDSKYLAPLWLHPVLGLSNMSHGHKKPLKPKSNRIISNQRHCRKWPFSTSSLPGPKQEKEGTLHSSHSNYFHCSNEVLLQEIQSPES